MPTKQWMKTRSLVVAWLTNKEKAAFQRECKKRGIGQSRAIRESLQVALGLPLDKDHTDAK